MDWMAISPNISIFVLLFLLDTFANVGKVEDNGAN